MSREEDGGKIAMGCLLIIIMIPVGILVKGFVLVKLWGWFVVPFGLMEINTAHSLGLSTCIALFHGVSSGSSKTDEDETMGKLVGKAVAGLLLAPLFVLFLGWVFHSFM